MSKEIIKPTSSFELLPKSYQAVKSNLNTFSLLWILPVLSILGSTIHDKNNLDVNREFGSAGSLNFGGVPGYAIASAIGIGIIVALVILLFALIVQAMTYALQLEAAKGKTPTLGHLFDVGKKYWLRLLGLAIVIGIVVVIGLIAFIIPGLIMIRRYFLAPFVLIDKDVTISEAMKESARISKPYSGYVWGVLGVTIALSLPGAIPVVGPIAAFLLGAIYSVAPALRYEELKKLTK